MALVVKDRVRETTTTVGTGTLTLNGAVAGFQSFSVIGNGNTTYYTISDGTTGAWEVGIGTYTSSGTTLSRDTVLESSNSNNLVNFSAGTKDVFVTYPADRSVTSDVSTTFTAAQTFRAANAVRSEAAATQDAVVVAGRAGGTNSYAVTLTPTTLTASRTFTFPDADGTALYSGGPLGTPSSGTVTNLTGTASININGTVGATTPAAGTFTSLTDSGNLTFTGTGNRITGDFSNGTVASRVMFQGSTTNATTAISIIPNGTGQTSSVNVHNGSDPANAAYAQLRIDTTSAQVTATYLGTGSYLPMTFNTGGSERMRIDSSGNVGIGKTPTAGYICDVQGYVRSNGGDFAAVYINSTNSGGKAWRLLGGSTSGTSGDLLIENTTDSVTAIRMTPTGNVGIGTSSPNKKLVVSDAGNIGIEFEPNASATTISRILSYNRGTSVYTPLRLEGSDIRFQTGSPNTERVIIDSSGNVGIGTSSPSKKFDIEIGNAVNGARVISTGAGSGACAVYEGISYRADGNGTFQTRFAGAFRRSDGTAIVSGQALGAMLFGGQWGTDTTYQSAKVLYPASIVGVAEGSFTAANAMATGISFRTGSTGDDAYSVNLSYGTERMRIDSSGNVGIGVTPSFKLDIKGGAGNGVPAQRWEVDGGSGIYVELERDSGGGGTATFGTATNHNLNFKCNDANVMFLAAGGNVGIGTSSPDYLLDVEKSTRADLRVLATGAVDFLVSSISSGSEVRLTKSGNSGPITFYNDTERMRILSNGDFVIGKTETNTFYSGTAILNAGGFSSTKSAGVVATFRRMTSDGDVVDFVNDAGSSVGTISISGSTVSYNAFAGSHWSQLQDGGKPDILRGTVLESINELCEWPGEDNERLPKCKISDTVSSKRVYGVFMSWDNDWTATNDMFVTGVGAFICRIHGSVTVQEGDLLESNGDGTARVQADDVIRSSTIGKVTSTIKSHEYDDGSYCVPAVLYCG